MTYNTCHESETARRALQAVLLLKVGAQAVPWRYTFNAVDDDVVSTPWLAYMHGLWHVHATRSQNWARLIFDRIMASGRHQEPFKWCARAQNDWLMIGKTPSRFLEDGLCWDWFTMRCCRPESGLTLQQCLRCPGVQHVTAWLWNHMGHRSICVCFDPQHFARACDHQLIAWLLDFLVARSAGDDNCWFIKDSDNEEYQPQSATACGPHRRTDSGIRLPARLHSWSPIKQ